MESGYCCDFRGKRVRETTTDAAARLRPSRKGRSPPFSRIMPHSINPANRKLANPQATLANHQTWKIIR